MQKKHEELLTKLNETSSKLFSCTLAETTEKQAYKVMCTMLREMLAKKRKEYKDSYKATDRKKVYYMSMEFLVGTSLRNNLYNLGVEADFRRVMKSQGFDIDSIYALDPDAVNSIFKPYRSLLSRRNMMLSCAVWERLALMRLSFARKTVFRYWE